MNSAANIWNPKHSIRVIDENLWW